MSSLKSLKADIKSWERAFRTERAREPTKEDIKADPALAAKYKLYRHLTKEAAAGEAALGPSSRDPQGSSAQASTSASSPTARGQYNDTSTDTLPKSSAAKQLFQTPTKPKPSGTPFLLTPKTPAFPYASLSTAPTSRVPITPSRRSQPPLNPFLSPSSASKSLGSEPILSPFSRPFPNLPSTPDTTRGTTGSGPTNGTGGIELISNSPRRLKQVLDATTSARRGSSSSSTLNGAARSGSSLASGYATLDVPSPIKGITPRTRARKRLRGEEVEDTPGRAKIQRTSSGGQPGGKMNGRISGTRNGSNGSVEKPAGSLAVDEGGVPGPARPLSDRGKNGRLARVPSSEEDPNGEEISALSEDDEEVFGPTPIKSSGKKQFGSVLGGGSRERSGLDKGKRKRGSPGDAVMVFGTVRGGKAPEPSSGSEDEEVVGMDALPTIGKGKLLFQSHLASSVQPVSKSVVGGAQDMGSSSPPAPLHRAPLTASSSPSTQRLNFSEGGTASADDDDEIPAPLSIGPLPMDEDEIELMDTDKGKKPQVDEDLAHDIEWSSSEEDDFDDDGEDHRIRRVHRIRVEPYRLGLQKRLAKRAAAEEEVEREDDSEDDNIDDRKDRITMSGLSLASPQAKVAQRTERLHAARAKAVFDPKAKRELQAGKRPKVFLPGEAAHEVDEDGEPVKSEEEEGDDDWESDPDGWKTVGLPDDDDW